MKPITLETLFPAHPVFPVKSKELEIHIRPPSLLDQNWIRQKYGSTDNLQKIFTEKDWLEMCRVVYHQMSQEDRAHFPATKAHLIDDDGNEANVVLTGPELLLHSLTGMEEITTMIGAFNRAWCLAHPEFEKEIAEEMKKKVQEINQLIQQTGEKSLTKSPRNTATQKKSLAP